MSTALLPERASPSRKMLPQRKAAGRSPLWRNRVSTVVSLLTWANLAGVLGLFVLLCVVSERWWFSAALTYLPRAPYAVPSLVCLAASIWLRPGILWANAVSLLLVVGPIMGLTRFSAPASEARTPAGLRVVSCNIQNGYSSLPRLMFEIERLDPDVLALQETQRCGEELRELLADWQAVHVGEFWIGARGPVRFVAECWSDDFDRRTAILCEVQTAAGSELIASVHLNTVRHGLSDLRWHAPVSGSGVPEFEEHQRRRAHEAAATRAWLDEQAASRPILIAGDFNTPTTSSLFVPHWSGLASAFEEAGAGYGYTAPCNTHRLWPTNMPWVRIDHILCSGGWSVRACGIGRTDGSDHRLIWADLRPAPRD
ncbi:MAG: endonuclease/exonuclease/phosphatase family protein [Planctomyces sp.]|nr:endonuclease/exonuclease/phosphatase family protein [Planctomyces sp.]